MLSLSVKIPVNSLFHLHGSAESLNDCSSRSPAKQEHLSGMEFPIKFCWLKKCKIVFVFGYFGKKEMPVNIKFKG